MSSRLAKFNGNIDGTYAYNNMDEMIDVLQVVFLMRRFRQQDY